jgi:hypothetical protein
MTATASLWEVLSIVANVVGLLAASRMFMVTRQRHLAVLDQPGADPHGPRVLAAWRHYRCEVTRIALHLVMVTIGGWALFLPDPLTWFGWVSMVLRTLLSVSFAVASVIDVLTDDHLMDLLGAEQPHGERR